MLTVSATVDTASGPQSAECSCECDRVILSLGSVTIEIDFDGSEFSGSATSQSSETRNVRTFAQNGTEVWNPVPVVLAPNATAKLSE
jgi:hypothetical protein